MFHIFIGIGRIIGGLALSLVFSSILGMLSFGIIFYGLIIMGILESLNGYTISFSEHWDYPRAYVYWLLYSF